MDYTVVFSAGLILLVLYLAVLTVRKIKTYSDLKKQLQECELKLVEIIAKTRENENSEKEVQSRNISTEWINNDLLKETASLLHSIKGESKARRILLSSQFLIVLTNTLAKLDSLGAKVDTLGSFEYDEYNDSESAELNGEEGKNLNDGLINSPDKSKNMSGEKLYEIGKKYRIGVGVARDPQKAFKYFKKSAEKGNIDGKTCVATCYMDGTGVQKDVNKAFSDLKELSEAGHLKATVNLGICYFNGLGVGKDIPFAFKLFQHAADGGDPQAKCNLGSFYQHGCWVKQNYQKAVKYFREASESGNGDAIYNLGRCYHNGEGIEKNVDKAIELYEDASRKGCTLSVCTLAHCYETGSGVSKDREKALELYKVAAERGNIFARSRLEQGLNQDLLNVETKTGLNEGIPGEL